MASLQVNPPSGFEQSAYLAVLGPHGPLQHVRLASRAVDLGRGAECAVLLDHPMVSRQHARLERRDGRWRVIDLKSHNGTRVNGVSASEHLLRDSDCVEIGPFKVTFHHRGKSKAWNETPSAQTIALIHDPSVAIRTLHELRPPHIALEHLNALDGFTRLLMESSSADQRLVALCSLMVSPGFGGHWAVAVAVTTSGIDPVVLSPMQFNQTPARDQASPYLSRSLLQHAFGKREPMLASNIEGGSEAQFELSISPDVMKIAAIAIPLPTSTPDRVDLLYGLFPPTYATGEWLALTALAVNHFRQAETIWANIHRNLKLAALEADLERGRQVQDRLVPRKPKLAGLDVAVRFRPCSAVGGDYVDVLPLPNGTALLVIADVCGKGLPAAMVAMGLHTIVHASARRWAGVGDLAAAVSAHLQETLANDSFVTFLAITLNPLTGELEAVNAGHPPALVIQNSGTFSEFGAPTSPPLGFADQPPTVENGILLHGQSVALFTDGCFEIENAQGEMIGTQIYAEHAARHLAGQMNSIADAADRLMLSLDELQGTRPPSDDRTMLLVRRQPVLVESL